jgi:hypothetical protein
MLFSCQFTRFPDTTRRPVAERVVNRQVERANNPDKI